MSLYRTPETSQSEDPTNSHHHHRQLQRESVVMQVVLWETSRNSSPGVSINFPTTLVFREDHVSFSCHYHHHHHEAPGSVLSTSYLLTLFILTRILGSKDYFRDGEIGVQKGWGACQDNPSTTLFPLNNLLLCLMHRAEEVTSKDLFMILFPFIFLSIDF